MSAVTTTNWSGNHTYAARRLLRPESVAELQAVVAGADRVRALGSRHTFTALPDTEGDLVELDALPTVVEVDTATRTVSVSAGVRYGELAARLHSAGWALATMASLPHISVAGAVATGTHGSGDRTQSLSAAVRALDLVGPDGSLRTVRRGEAGFEGSVVALGALGVVTRLELDVEPTYDMVSRQYVGLGWEGVDEHLDAVLASADSVSLFTDWTDAGVAQVWAKSRSSLPEGDLFGARPAAETVHMLVGVGAEAVTQQHGVPGPWHERLPHFRPDFTPSRGDELQSEYLLPRDQAHAALAALRGLARQLAPVLHMSEIRTVAADDLWLSGAYEQDSLAIHFTWRRDVPGVYAVLPQIEDVLLPRGGRPHWGKCFVTGPEQLRAAFPRLPEFAELRTQVDPDGVFSNAYLERLLGR